MIRKTAIAICVLSLAYIGASVALAQTGSGPAWTQIGTLPGSATVLALDPTRSAAVYALGKDGISRSTDAGATWNVCGSDARAMSVAGNPATIYSMGPKGLRQSPDGCDSWKDVPAQGVQPSSANVRWLAPYPNNPRILYAGMDGLGGVYRSTDSGGTWDPAAKGLPSGGWVTAFTADAKYPERVIVGLKYNTRQHSPAYVYKSIDGGLTWRSASLGLHMLPNNGGEVTGLAWSGNDLFAATATDGLYESTDRGESWRQATMPRETAQQPAARLTRLSALAPAPAPLG